MFIGGSNSNTGIFNTKEGEIKNTQYASIDAGLLLTHSNIERFNITGTKHNDRLIARQGDILDGFDGFDKLDLDFAEATSNIKIDFNVNENQVSYNETKSYYQQSHYHSRFC